MIQSLRKFYFIMRGFRRQYARTMVVGAVAVCFDTLALVFFGSLVAGMVGSGEQFGPVFRVIESAGLSSDRRILVLILFGLYLTKSVLMLQFIRTLTRMSQDLCAVHQRKFLTGVLRDIPYEVFIRKSSSDFTHKSVQVLRGFCLDLVQQGSIALINATTAGLIFVYLFIINPVSTAVLAFTFCLIGLIYARVFSRLLNQVSWKLHHHLGRLMTVFSEAFYLAKDSRIHGHERKYLELVTQDQQQVSRMTSHFYAIQSAPKVVFEVLLCFAFLVLTAGLDGKQESSALLISGFAVFLIAAMKMLPAWSQILSTVALFNANYASIDLIYKELLELESFKGPDAVVSDRKQVAFTGWKTIEFKGVDFNYEEGSPVLKDLSVVIEEKKITGISGASGGGKSTFLDVLLCLLEPDAGSVLLGGKPFAAQKGLWQQQVGYMGQNPFLIDGTLGANLTLMDAGAEPDLPRAYSCLERVGLREFASAEGLTYAVGERGARLSGGQRQRLVFARMLYSDKSVLVLDEPTASLDSRSAEAVIQCINSLKSDRTVIIVSHSAELLRNCDVVYELRNGSVQHAS